MAITDDLVAAKKSIILMELGEPPDSSGVLSQAGTGGLTLMDNLWSVESVKGGSDLELGYLYTKRKAIDLLIGAIWRGAYMPVGVVQSKALDDKLTFLQNERKTVQDLIDNYIYAGTFTLDIYEPDYPLG